MANFCGTTQYFRSTFGRLKLTDGIQYLWENLDCYWLIDLVQSYQPGLNGTPFQLWRIRVHEDRSATIDVREDSDAPPIIEQNIPYTDFQLEVYEFYCTGGVVMLKSEY